MHNKIHYNRELSIWEALIPVIALVLMLGINVWIFGDSSISGTNQFVLLLGAAVGILVGRLNKTPFQRILDEVAENIKSTVGALLILLMVGALAGAWMVSGIIPAMIYYGLKVLSPTIFLPSTLVICSVISLATGSSWTTSATVGIALMGIGTALGFNPGMVAGAVISGAYFGDKLSPMSDTTNLAPAMAGTDLFTHIRYMIYTTVPTYIITFILFVVLGLTVTVSGNVDVTQMSSDITKAFHVTPVLFVVPIIVVAMILLKVEPLVALFAGVMLGGLFTILFQPQLLPHISGFNEAKAEKPELIWNDFVYSYKGVMNAFTVEVKIPTENASLEGLFKSGGMAKMLPTIWLILCAMVFGGVMDAIGALARITAFLLSFARSIFGLFASTVASCLALNVAASDQYLAIVVPGKMFSKAFKDRGLAPENLSRTLEDTGTVTSALVPWNTCGAYQSGVLGVPTFAYLPYAFFNIISPFMTIIFAAFHIKIKMLAVGGAKTEANAVENQGG